MCQSDNNPAIEQTTAEGYQWVFNVARNSRSIYPQNVNKYTQKLYKKEDVV